MDRNAEARRQAIAMLNEAPPPVRLLSPIDYIFADHFRHRTLCRVLDDIAQGAEFDRETVIAALRFLETDYRIHLLDEEEDLFPLLRQRAAAEDCVDEVLDQLSLEHGEEQKTADAVIEKLSAMLGSRGAKPADADFRDQLRRFAAQDRRHLTVENAIVLPLARARLSPGDLRDIGKSMAARRGLEYPEPNSAA
jgi:hemerythrin-like domain-containing protein